MDLEDYDCKPVKVKLESDLIKNENVEMDNYLNDSNPEADHQVHIPFSPKCNLVSEKTDLNLMNNLPLDTHSASSTNLDVQNVLLNIKEEKVEDEYADSCSEASHEAPFAIYLEQSLVVHDKNDFNLMYASSASDVPFVMSHVKEEIMEDEDPLADSCLNDLRWNSPKATQYARLKNDTSFSQEVIRVPRESITMEAHEIIKEKQFEIVEVLEVKSEGMSDDVTVVLPHTKKTHLEHIHSTERPFPCKECSARFKRKAHLQEHLEHIHSPERRFPCKECSARFKRKGHLQEHLERIHSTERPFPCKECSARFKQKGHLQEHLERIHSTERPFPCNECSARFKRKSHLQEHLESRHSTERPFPCTECSARFKRKTYLQEHLERVHLDEKPFPCNECSTRYKRKADLHKHLERVHSDKKSFSCNECST